MKALFILMTMCCLLQARPFIALFGSADCDQCAELKELWGNVDESVAQNPSRPVMIYICIDDADNYFYLKKLERTLNLKQPSEAFPFVLVGNRLYAGKEGLFSVVPQLDKALKTTPRHPLLQPLWRLANQATSPVVAWNATAQSPNEQEGGMDASSENTQAGQVAVSGKVIPRLLYLATPGCQKCARQETELKFLRKKMPALQIDKYLVSEKDGLVQMARVVKFFAIEQAEDKNLAPLVAWDNGVKTGYITGRLAEIEELMAVLGTAGKENARPFWDAPITEEEMAALESRQKGFLEHSTWLTTLAAGLIDGINPCAFATVIFLISYLLYLKRGRRYILAVGLCFCAGVFMAYLLFGIGLSFLVDYLARFAVIKKVVYAAFALLGGVLCVLHLRDALRYRRTGKVQDMDMGLDASTHNRIHKKIHKWSAMSGYLAMPAAVLLGCVVSSMEFVCTGQVYLPMIMAINANGFNARALQWLLLYNIAFIAPLLLVTFMAYHGVGAKAISTWAREHIFATKLAMAALFMAIAILMLILIL